MPLPTTNLTAHFDSSDADHLYQNYQAGSPYHNTAVADTDPVGAWDGELVADQQWKISADKPIWTQSGTPLAQPCIDFNAAKLDLYNRAGTVVPALSTMFTNTSFSALISFVVQSASLNSGNPWENHVMLSTTFAGFGVLTFSIKAPLSVPHFTAFHFPDTLAVPIEYDTRYFAHVRHTGGNLYVSLNGGSESSIASGNTWEMAVGLTMGYHPGQSAVYDGFIGELAIYSAALTGSDQTDANNYFYDKWIADPVVQQPQIMVIN